MMGHPLIMRPPFFFLCRVVGKNVDSKLSWQQYCLFIRVTRSKEEPFFTQSAVITKVKITPFSMGILFFICLNLLLTKGKE